MKAPPPIASTSGSPASSRRITRRSPSRNSRSPKRSNSSGIVQPAAELDLGVGVAERQPEPRRQSPPDRGFARAHQPDQHDRAPRQRRGQR